MRTFYSPYIVTYVHHHQFLLSVRFSMILCLYCPFLGAGLLDCIQCSHEAHVCMSFLNSQALPRPSCSSYLDVLWDFCEMRCFMRWGESGRRDSVLLGAASRICSKQHLAFLCCSRQACVDITSSWWDIAADVCSFLWLHIKRYI